MRPEPRQSRPAVNGTAQDVTRAGDTQILPLGEDVLADLDALAEHLRGVYVLQVVINDAGHRRTSWFRSAGAAERAVERARARGRVGHVSLVQMLPVGVIVGLSGGSR